MRATDVTRATVDEVDDVVIGHPVAVVDDGAVVARPRGVRDGDLDTILRRPPDLPVRRRAGVREHGIGNREAERQLPLRDVVRAGVRRQDTREHPVQLAGSTRRRMVSIGEAEPLDLVVGDEVKAPLGDAHDVEHRPCSWPATYEQGVTPTARWPESVELFDV